MATNGNNGPRMTYSGQPDIEKGIGGHLQSRAIKSQFSSDFWKKEGYLDTAINELKQQQELYKEMSKISEQMSKRDQKAIKDKLLAYKQQLEILRTIKREQEVSDLEALDIMKTSNKLLEKGQQKYIELLNDESGILQGNADLRLDSLDQAIQKQKDLNRETKNQDIQIKRISKTLNQSTDNWATSIGKSINGIGDKLKELSNMFNLQSIANSMLEQNARSKAAIMSNVNKQFGFTSNSQFEAFKNSLNDTMKSMNRDMGAIFNSSDLKEYMANLSTYGITSTKMAQEQMRASIIGNKYLGVSVETQSAIFKYMKLTNNNDALNNHNKTVVALLKSDLGISKDQLDKISQIARSTQDDLLAAGMSPENLAKLQEQIEVYGGIVESKFGPEAAEAFVNSINDLATAKYTDAERINNTYGIYGMQMAERLQNTSDVGSILPYIMNRPGFSSSGNVTWDQTILSELGVTNTSGINVLSAMQDEWSSISGLANDIFNGVKSIDEAEIQRYVKESTQTTELEKIQNMLDVFINGIPWKWTMNLANVALLAYLAAKPFEIYGYFKNLNLAKLLTKSLGEGGAVGGGMSALSAGTVTVGLTAAAVAALAIGITAASKSIYGLGKNEESVNSTVWSDQKREDEGWLASGAHDWWEGVKNRYAAAGGTIHKGIAGQLFGNKNAEADGAWTQNMAIMNSLKDPNDRLLFWLSTLMLFDKGNVLQYVDTDENHSSIVNRYNGLTDEEKQKVREYAEWTQDNPVRYVRDYNRNVISVNSIDWSNYHKNGLAWVPKDNYKALLHKGEMVLNERDANLYRAEHNVGGESVGLYNKQQKIILGDLVPSSKDPGYAGTQMGLPAGWSVTSAYGTYTGIYDSSGKIKQHKGIDFAAPTGTPIKASRSGSIIIAGNAGDGFGNSIKISTGGGIWERYGHLSKFASGIKTGVNVHSGQLIGYVGNTGNSTGPHLHYQVDNAADGYNNDINPWPYINMAMFGGSGDLGLSSPQSGATSGAVNSDTGIQLKTRRFIPKAFRPDTGGQGGDTMNRAVDNGINKIITYLDGVRAEQAEQRKLINAFAKSRSTELTL